ncbi:hypothetical protein AB833_15810 [Chromatiales bacterium (ex Bugula neritina AB1)]|nr:hypothetical protein AB833_15810 [Chromatiales bacterium (ex Bugula neritina AB1)]
MTRKQISKTRSRSLPAELPESIKLPPIGSWQHDSAHSFDDDQRHAISAAWYADRPLLVRGEPGLGKSQIARAIAASWQWRLVTTVIHGRTEVDDLLYTIDYVERLADANASVKGKIEVKDLADYVKHGPVWQALDGDSQSGWPEGGYGKKRKVQGEPGCILLLDEIDKAQSDVPNALLEVLNSKSFTVPQTGQVVSAGAPLFIVVTANDQRTLPAAFMRRCAVLDLDLGSDEAERFRQIAQAHSDAELLQGIDADTIDEVAKCVAQYRKKVPEGYYQPGTSEMLDILHVIDRSDKLPDADLEKCLTILSKFLLKKGFRTDEAD